MKIPGAKISVNLHIPMDVVVSGLCAIVVLPLYLLPVWLKPVMAHGNVGLVGAVIRTGTSSFVVTGSRMTS